MVPSRKNNNVTIGGILPQNMYVVKFRYGAFRVLFLSHKGFVILALGAGGTQPVREKCALPSSLCVRGGTIPQNQES